MHFSLWKNNLRIIEFYENTRQKHYAEKMYANRRKRFSGRQMAFAKGNKGSIYHDGWIDFNKNGEMDIFENPKQPIEKRVQDLLSQMNLDEKTCQLATLYGYKRVMSDSLPTPEWKNKIWKDGIANIDEQLNGVGRGARKSPKT